MDAIAAMMQRYPVTAFSSGFGRTLFLTFRPFLIRAAFANNQACFLEKEEWVTIVESTIRSDYDKGKGGILAELNERVINEVVKVPGLVARASSLHTGPNIRSYSESVTLLHAITQCKNRLRELQEQILCALEDLRGPIVDMHRYLGPIPVLAANKFSQGCLEGVEWTLTLLDSLEHQATHHFALQQPMAFGLADRDIILGVDTFSQASVVSYDVSPDIGWLDRCALSLGVIPSRS